MAELATVARPYAEALFRVAQSGDMNAWSAIASELGQIGAHADVQAYAANPNVTPAQLADTIAALVKSPSPVEERQCWRRRCGDP
jgi:F-type H+-transporting ATPase subunit delta